MDRLSLYPYVVVRVACERCPWRRGSYRLARLAEKYGAETPLDELIGLIAFDCPFREGPHRRRGNQYVPKCHARFVDLEGPPRPPDLPPAMRAFSVVKGGKE